MTAYPAPRSEAETFWTARYGDSPIWSGRPNASLVDTLGPLVPGSDDDPASDPVGAETGPTALDLGSGEGGDALWLAAQGWRVTAVDIAPNALDRGRAEAERAGLGDRVRWVQADLAAWDTDDRFDLVSASFLHSSVSFPRAAVLRRATTFVAPGGRLLVIGHAGSPSWAAHEEHAHAEPLVGPGEQVSQLALGAGWTVEVAELRTRTVTGSDGGTATLEDSVVLARRT
ncbi:cyclopropane-fatty-acyl-phospholipid synthase family protein [Curtobacterium sp. MCBD17_008]|uniref:SAM-dependent methyltransferase n=1 Tax=Curtobacterium sp. MCBD17_008 TaxID=2175656 RepID=UPI000DA8FCC4|nr:class I SAM-dependent methyltransferase [Curtobacterium sp. MCBD17_008]PZE88670.1 class I SAM-dependent methyltransferase [Curtobacterium sp. MCBD17_008]